MTEAEAARALAALGHTARLGLFRLLVRAAPDGLSIGDLGRAAGMPASTLAHHLAALVEGGLVTQERVGRAVINRARIPTLRAAFRLVEAECCAGVELPDAADAA